MCAQKISSIVWGWTLSMDFVYGTDCFCEVVCSGESPSPRGPLAGDRVQFTGSLEHGQERRQRRGPLGDLKSLSRTPLESKIVTLFYLFLKLDARWAVGFSYSLAPGADIFMSTAYIPCQFTSAHIHMCGRNFDGVAFCPPNSIGWKLHAPDSMSSLAPICSKSVSRWRWVSVWYTLLAPRRRPQGLSPWVVWENALCLHAAQMPIANMCSLFIVLVSYPPTQPGTTQADRPQHPELPHCPQTSRI